MKTQVMTREAYEKANGPVRGGARRSEETLAMWKKR